MGFHGVSNDELFVRLVHDQLCAAATAANASSPTQLGCNRLIQDAYFKFAANSGPTTISRRVYFMAAAEVFRRLATSDADNSRVAQEAAEGILRTLIRHRLETLSITNDLVTFNWALDRISQRNERAAEVVKLRCFAGLNREEAAELLSISLKAEGAAWKHGQFLMENEVNSDQR